MWRKWFTSSPDTAGLRPVGAETTVYNEYLVGRFDMLLEEAAAPGHYVIVDWKRSWELRPWSDKFMRGPFSRLRDTNLSHYTLQVGGRAGGRAPTRQTRTRAALSLQIPPRSGPPGYESGQVHGGADPLRV